jgi:ATP-dependent Clp protease protease subunit
MEDSCDCLQVGQNPIFEEQVFIDALKERTIIFNQEVDESILERVIYQILKWNKEDEGISIDERKRITIIVSSNGGMVTNGLVCCSVIENSLTPIIGIAISAYSMGALIFISCHKRIMYDTSSLLLHSGELGIFNSSKKAKNTMNFYEKLDLKIQDLILRHSTIDKELLLEKFDGDDDWYLLSEECLKYGLADNVITR